MKNINLEQIHDSVTDESNSFIKVDKLLDITSHLSIEQRIEIFNKCLSTSENVNNEYIESLKKYRMFAEQRKMTERSKRKVVAVKKVRPIKKEYIAETIDNYKSEIKKIIDLNYDDFVEYVLVFEEPVIDILLCGIEKEIVAYQRMADEVFKEKAKDFLDEIRQNIYELEYKKSYLSNLKFDDILVENKCRILFLETSSNRSYFKEDIEGYEEFFPSFAKIFKSLENGNPIDTKSFTDNEALRGLVEVRDKKRQTRIFFDKLDDNTYIIINAIIKKVNSKSSVYQSQMKMRYKLYLQQKPYILENVNNEDFLARQEEHLREAKELLGLSDSSLKKVKEVK